MPSAAAAASSLPPTSTPTPMVHPDAGAELDAPSESKASDASLLTAPQPRRSLRLLSAVVLHAQHEVGLPAVTSGGELVCDVVHGKDQSFSDSQRAALHPGYEGQAATYARPGDHRRRRPARHVAQGQDAGPDLLLHALQRVEEGRRTGRPDGEGRVPPQPEARNAKARARPVPSYKGHCRRDPRHRRRPPRSPSRRCRHEPVSSTTSTGSLFPSL
jgi:hypothetical protein